MGTYDVGLFDIVTAGGGPAGAAASILLKRAGARVALVDGGAPPARVEGLSPRVVAILAAQGLAAEGVGPAVARQADWGKLTGAPNREHPVERAAFDAGLWAQAAAEGVTVISGTIRRAASGRLDLADGRSIRAGLIVEARGRRAPAAAGRRRGPGTVAIGGWTGAPRAHASIAAQPDGWVWTAPMPEGAWTQVVVDAATARSGPAAAWRRVTAEPVPRCFVVRGAELRLAAPSFDPGRLRIGDAAVAMDPLSGHGVFWALSSALAAVPLARAVLDGELALAARFYQARVVDTFWRQARIGRDFHRLAGFDTPFWTARAAWPDALPAEPKPPQAPLLRRQVVVKKGRLAEATALVTPRDPAGVAFVQGREIAPILARIERGPLPGRAAFQSRILPDAPPEVAGAIHDFLRHRGVTTADLPIETEVAT